MSGEEASHRVTATSANQDTVLRAFSAGNCGEVGPFLDCLQLDVEWRSGGIFIHPLEMRDGRVARVLGFGALSQARAEWARLRSSR